MYIPALVYNHVASAAYLHTKYEQFRLFVRINAYNISSSSGQGRRHPGTEYRLQILTLLVKRNIHTTARRFAGHTAAYCLGKR